MRRAALSLCATLLTTALAATPHNVVIFVADGLRAGSVNPTDAPNLFALAHRGVRFANSHALFPTFTTPNAAAIATGHYLGDNGDLGNSLYSGYRLFEQGDFGRSISSSVSFIESDTVLGDLDAHFGGNYLGEPTLLSLARDHGISTAAIGKLGPAGIQDAAALAPQAGRFALPLTLIIDDASGTEASPPLPEDLQQALRQAGLPLATPARRQRAGDATHPGTLEANQVQQDYFIAATTHAVLPLLERRGAPFVLVYWSRDPDGTQHDQGDSLNRLTPGINGPTSRAAVRDADDNLRAILQYLRADARLAANTDVFVTSDHGFATISKQQVDAAGHTTHSASAQRHYDDVPPGFLPPGFLAIDLAQALQLPLFDPDRLQRDEQGVARYQRITDTHPRLGHGFIGGSGRAHEPTDAQLIVAANGGSDLIYLPHSDAMLARRVVAILTQLDYVGALFVDERYGQLPGTLPLSSVGLKGASELPRPAMVVSFKSFLLDAASTGVADPQQNAVQISDSTLQQGQGMHGGFGRDSTFNFMAAEGPDFKQGYEDSLPVSNADITPTLRQLLGLEQGEGRGTLTGRILEEALREPAARAHALERCRLLSRTRPDGLVTVLDYQRYDGRLYWDEALLRARASHESSGCHRP